MSERARNQYEMFREYEFVLTDWRKDSKGYHDFYLGRQFTKQQEVNAMEKGIPLLSLNRVRPIIDHQTSILTAKPPQFRARPVSPADTGLSKVFDDMMIWRWTECDGNLHIHEAIRHMLIYGVGWEKVYVDTTANFGKPHVMVEHIHPHDVFPDPSSRRPDLRDARYVFQRAHLSGKDISMRWPDANIEGLETSLETDFVDSGLVSKDGALTRAELDDRGLTMRMSRQYEVIEGYERVMMPFVSFWDEGGVCRGAVPAEEYKGWEDKVSELGLAVRKYPMPRIKMLVTCGETVLDEGVLPISDYPLVPYFNSHDGVITGASEVMFLVDPQKAQNAVTNLIIQNLATSTNAPWIFEEGSLDERKLKENGSVQGGSVSYRPGAPAPTRVPPPSVPQALFMFPQTLQAHMEYVTGSFGTSQGQTEDSPETYRATLQIEEWGNRRMGKKSRTISSSLRRLGNIVMELMQRVYSTPEIIRVVGEDGIDKTFAVNIQAGTNVLHDITAGQYDVQVLEDSTIATSVMANEALNIERFKMGLIDKTQYIKEGSFKDKEDLIQRLGEVQQAQGAIEQMQKTIKSRDIQIGQMENEVRRGERRATQKEFELDLEATITRERLRLEKERAKLQEQQRKLAEAERNLKQNPPGRSAGE